MADTLEIFGVEYTGVTGIIAKDDNGTDLTFTRGGGSPTLQTKTKTYTPTESAQTETVSADSGYDGIDTVSISVGAISNTYVGTGITRRSSSDLTASGATVTVPSGYYSAQASKAVASGTAGTPTATKGTVSNHSVSVTPSVTNTAGYISGGTHPGTAVTVTASELVSGSETKTANGTYDVTNLAELVVNVSGGQTTEIIIPEQTITTTSSSTEVQVPVVNKPIVAGEEYIITVDGVSATATAESLYSGIWLYHIQGQVAIEQYNEVYFYTNSSYVGTHTVKVEKVSGGGLTTQIVLPEQSITATTADTNGYSTHITNLVSEELTADENYIVTMDGETYLCHTENIYSAGDTYMGDVNVVWGNAANAIYPFCCATWANHVTDWMVADNSAHTVKIERVVSYDASVLTTKSITANGTYSASSDNADGYSQVTVNVSGGGSGGLEHETGTLTLSSDQSTPIISFTNTHTDVPIYINITDVTETLATDNSNLYWTFMNWYTLNDSFIKTTSSSNIYGRYQYGWKTSSGASAGNIDCTNTGTGSAGLYYLVATDRFGPYCGGTSRYWRAGRTYKWIAVWAPTA